MTLSKKPLKKNIVVKGENAGNQHFLIFPQSFQFFKKKNIIILAYFILLSPNAFSLDKSKISLFGTSNFSFPHSIFYLFGKLSAIFIKFKIADFKLFQFGRV